MIILLRRYFSSKRERNESSPRASYLHVCDCVYLCGVFAAGGYVRGAPHAWVRSPCGGIRSSTSSSRAASLTCRHHFACSICDRTRRARRHSRMPRVTAARSCSRRQHRASCPKSAFHSLGVGVRSQAFSLPACRSLMVLSAGLQARKWRTTSSPLLGREHCIARLTPQRTACQ
jgi:hypothetical protein